MKEQLLAQDIKNVLIGSGADTSQYGPIIVGFCDAVLLGMAPPQTMVNWLLEERPWPVGHPMNLSAETAAEYGVSSEKMAVWDALKLLAS